MRVATFKDEHLEQAPPFLRDPAADTLHKAQGDAKDSLVDRARHAIKARFALIAPEDALPRIAFDRQLAAGPGESAASWAARLVGAWAAWPLAGTASGVLNALWDAGYPTAQLVTQRGHRFALDGSRQRVRTIGPAVTFDPPNFWNTFLVYFEPPLPAAWVSGGVPADGSPESERMKRLVKKWKASYARFDRVVIRVSGHVWGELGLVWGAAGAVWGGVTVEWIP